MHLSSAHTCFMLYMSSPAHVGYKSLANGEANGCDQALMPKTLEGRGMVVSFAGPYRVATSRMR